MTTTTTTRKPFSVTTRKAVLKNEDGTTVKCAFPGCSHNAFHIHHEHYCSNGGTNEVSNLKPMCSQHHIQLHSVRGDFRNWGSKGGQKTAASMKSLKNLPQYRGADGQKRLEALIDLKNKEARLG